MNCEPEIVKEMREREKQKLLHNSKEESDNIIINNFFNDTKGLIEEKFRIIFENANDGIAILDLTGNIIEVNPSALNIFDSSKEEIVGKNLSKLGIADINEIPVLAERHKNIIKGKPQSFNLWIKNKEGKKICLQCYASVVKSGQKAAYVILIMTRNNKVRKIVEETSQDSEDKLRLLVENAPIGIYFSDLNGKFQYCNKRCEEIIGCNSNNLIGKSFLKLKLLNKPERPKVTRLLELNKMGKGSGPNEFTIIRGDGTTCTIKVRTRALEINENKIVVGFVEDITDEIKIKRDLSENEECFHTIFNEMVDAVAIVDNKGLVLEVSNKIVETTGYARGELKGKNILFLPIFDDKTKRELLKNIALRLMGKNIPPYEVLVHKKDGKTKSFELKAERVHYKGKLVDMAVFRDISERKEAQEQMLESEQKYKKLFELGPDAVFLLDKKGRFIDINDAFNKKIGYKKGEIIGVSIKKAPFIPLKSKLKSYTKFKKLMHGEEVQPFIINVKSKEGIIFQKEINVGIIREKDGISGLIGIARDITEQKRIEEKYKMITENTSDLISLITFEMKPKYTYLSPSHERIMGYKPDELEGRIATELVHPDDVKQLLILLSNYVKTKTKKFFGLKGLPSSEKIEYRIKDKNGIWRYLSGTADLAGNKILIVSKDITEQKNAERQLQEAHKKLQDMNKSLEKKVAERTAKIEQLLKQKDEFIGQLGHDLKNPLNPLINLIPVLEKEEDNEKHKEILEVINRNVQYMRNLVIKTIELAKLNSPNIKFSMEKLNLMTEFDKIVKKNMMLFSNKKITVNNNIPKNIEIKADQLRFEELLENLFNNSIKYNSELGSITLDAKENGKLVTVSVCDTGIGMTKEQISKVFSEFYKADESRHDFDSSGLGMPICKRIVERHGGKIWVESSGLGKGSTFYFTIPSIY